MMIKSKRTVAGMAVATALVICYIFYATGDSAPPGDDMKEWAKLILMFIAVSVIAQIVTQIAVHVAFAASIASKEQSRDERTIKRVIVSEMAEDEMDQRITFRSSHVGYGMTGAGFVLILIAIVFMDLSVALLLNMLLMVFFVSMIAGGIVSLVLYEVGDNGSVCRGRGDE